MNPAILLGNFLSSLTAQTVTNVILGVLLAVFLWATFQAKRGRWKDFVHYTPNLLISLGIFGTFVGIVIGLLDFDINRIDSSIGLLLDGLKTAFMTSLVGMLLAIVFKSLDSAGKLKPLSDTEEEPYTATPEDILASLRHQEAALERLTKAIAGNEDSTLITQIRSLRTDVQDANRTRAEEFEKFQEKLWKQMAEFAEMLSKSATETVIEALRQVIVDFNQNLTEQFGENFKQLNAAVEKLVEWQERYRDQLGQMIEQYALGALSIRETEVAVARISEETKVIPETMGALQAILQTAQHQINELERHLHAFSELRDRAVEAVPQIQQNVDKLVRDISSATDGLTHGSERVREQLESTIKGLERELTEMIGTLADSSSELKTDMESVHTQVMKSFETMQKRLQTTLEEIFQAQTREMNRAFQAVQDELKKSVAKTGEVVEGQIGVLDEAMQQELERVISMLGQNLTAVTTKFADDYSGLTAQMQRVINRAAGPEPRVPAGH